MSGVPNCMDTLLSRRWIAQIQQASKYSQITHLRNIKTPLGLLLLGGKGHQWRHISVQKVTFQNKGNQITYKYINLYRKSSFVLCWWSYSRINWFSAGEDRTAGRDMLRKQSSHTVDVINASFFPIHTPTLLFSITSYYFFFHSHFTYHPPNHCVYAPEFNSQRYRFCFHYSRII